MGGRNENDLENSARKLELQQCLQRLCALPGSGEYSRRKT